MNIQGHKVHKNYKQTPKIYYIIVIFDVIYVLCYVY